MSCSSVCSCLQVPGDIRVEGEMKCVNTGERLKCRTVTEYCRINTGKNHPRCQVDVWAAKRVLLWWLEGGDNHIDAKKKIGKMKGYQCVTVTVVLCLVWSDKVLLLLKEPANFVSPFKFIHMDVKGFMR